MKNLLAVCLLFLTPLLYAQDKMQASGDEKPSAAHPAGAAGFKAEAQKLVDAWKAAYQSKDADKVAALYTDDAVWINPDGTFHGTGDIKGEVKKMLDRGDVLDSLIATRAVRSGDLGFAEGTFTGKARSDAGERPMAGIWAITVKNKDGKWMIASDSDLEANRAGMKRARQAKH